jgi:Domain of unknown function (DUF4194)
LDNDAIELLQEESTESANALFAGDTGELPLDTRRALMQLLAGPFVSGSKHSKLWAALMRDELVIRRRLSELFLDVVIDRDQQVAFVKQVDSQGVEAPTLLRKSQLTFIDSALILHLRRRLTAADANGERAVVSEQEIGEHLSVYERAANTDRAGFLKRVKASIEKCKKNNILQPIRGTKDRFEVSPTLKLLFSAAEIVALTNLYVELASADAPLTVRKRKSKDFDIESADVDEADDD